MTQPEGRDKIVSTSSSNANRTMKSTADSWNLLAFPKSGPALLLSYLIAGSLYCCIVVAQLEPNRIDSIQAAVARVAKTMKQDANLRMYDDKISIDQRNYLILIQALEEFCAINPLECHQDDPLTCNSSAKQTVKGDLNSEDQSISKLIRVRSNRTGGRFAGWDELAEGQSIWLPKLSTVESERDVGTQDIQQISHTRWPHHAAASMEISDDIERKLLNMLEGQEAQASDRVLVANERSTRASGKFKRNREFKLEQQQQPHQKRQPQPHQRYGHEAAAKQEASNNRQNKYRLTVEEAKRIIRAFRRDRTGLVGAPSASQVLLGSGNELAGRNYQHLRVVPKRTDLSGDETRLDGDGDSRASRQPTGSIITSKTSGFQFEPEPAKTDGLAGTNSPSGVDASLDDESIQCNMRRFIYRATKTDQAGNQCTGLITANICYGACDTGEIADWLFPHKKPIHKVCRHGGRIRRMRRLTECTSSSGLSLALDGAPDDGPLLDLQQYYYVDALDCVCRRCTSADTTCLGTMSRPSLPTLGELGHTGNRNNDDEREQKYRQQISSLGID